MEKREKLDALFTLKTVAIVGASDKYDQISGRPLKFFLRYGYKGKIFPVNPKHETLCGIKCFARIEDIPENIDLVLIAVPNKIKADTKAIVDALLRVSELAIELEDKIAELDINLFFVFEDGRGGKVGDALMILR